jgi:methionine synthase II (cobalamin-independent)
MPGITRAVTPSTTSAPMPYAPTPYARHKVLRYAAIVGRENIVAGTDCGLGGRVHADLAWAKLRTLVEGAGLASTSLWP